jgi:hypothetical protein
MGVLPFHLGPAAHLGLVLSIALSLSPGTSICADTGADLRLDPSYWGGHGAALTVAEQGATVEFDCAMGYIRQPVALQPDGRFSVLGEFVPDSGGPVRLSDPKPQGSPAVFSGEVSDSRLLLHVDIPDEGRTLGPFTLVRSKTAKLEKCL